MTPTAWLLAGSALALVPGTPTARARAAALVGRTRAPAGDDVDRGHVPRHVPRILIVAAAATAALAGVATVGVTLGLTATIAVATATGMGLRAVRSRAQQAREQTLLAAVRLLVAEVAAGGSPASACAAAADIAVHHRAELLAAARADSLGVPPTFTDPALAMLGHAWRLAAVTGAPVAATLERVADDLAARIDHRRAVHVAASGAQASALMLAVLPVVGIVLGIAMGAHPVAVLVGTPTGRALCLLGVCLDCAGVLWTARLSRRALR